MLTRRPLLCIAALALCAGSLSAAPVRVRTTNFLVEAPDENIARQFGQMAEHYRKQKAVEWLGQEIPNWTSPCPLFVKPTMGGAGGATSFNYDRGGYTIISMTIEGSLERMLNSVLPHEVTHTVFAHYFRAPVPRWADEGGSVLSEDDHERNRHDQLCRQFLNTPGKKFPLRRLFNLKEYHEAPDVMLIYAEGYSVTNYLVEASDRETFLNFVSMGMRQGWDKAVQTYYQLQSVEQLEETWLAHLRATRGMARNSGNRGTQGTMIAANPSGRASATAVSREVVRLTAPPAQPQIEPAGATFRGQAGDDRGRPSYLPPPPPGVKPLNSNGHPATNRSAASTPPPPVRLGLPEFAPMPQGKPIQPQGPSPVGFQN